MNSNSRYSLLTKLCYGVVLGGMLAFGTLQATAQTHVVVHGSVFGGGNEAAVSGNTEVLMQDQRLWIWTAQGQKATQ